MERQDRRETIQTEKMEDTDTERERQSQGA